MSPTATLIDGKLVSQKRIDALKETVAKLVRTTHKQPGLAVILVGDDPASKVYVGRKQKACQDIGIHSVEHRLPANTEQADLEALIVTLNQDDAIHGILLQLPLPKHLDEQHMLQLIDPKKDVDGFHPTNLGKLLIGDPASIPCTPYGVCELLAHYTLQTEGKHVVIVGRSNIVGKPLAALLLQKGPFANATVTVCHSRTQNLASLTQQADIIIAAIGIPEFITADMVKPGAVVIDVGINRIDANNDKGYRLVGDVDFDAIKDKASAITPVPGGVGPMTIAMLMTNTVEAFSLSHQN